MTEDKWHSSKPALMSWLSSPHDFKARMPIEWRQILASSWCESPVRDCVSFHLQINELDSFDAAVGGMLSVPVWANRGWDNEKCWDYWKVEGCQVRWMQDLAIGAQITQTQSEVEVFGSRGASVSSTCTRVFRCKRMHVHINTQTHSSAKQPALKVQTSYWAALQSAGLMKRYHVLHYSSMWGSGD